jgi:hypothetical protein
VIQNGNKIIKNSSKIYKNQIIFLKKQNVAILKKIENLIQEKIKKHFCVNFENG